VANYYDVLGVEPSATQDDLRRAYYRRAQLLHPDRHAGAAKDVVAEAERSLRELNEAWSVLRDPQQRHRYDKSIGSAASTTTHTGGRVEAQFVGAARRLMWIGLAVIGVALLIDSFGRGLLVALIGLAFFAAGVAGSRRRPR
jgi:DnaJ-class molecular chaperone